MTKIRRVALILDTARPYQRKMIRGVAASRSTLEARFRKIMHKTIHEEIQSTMLACAQQLIVEGRLTLKQVTSEAGFAHAQHLTNLFRQRLGQTPGEFQRMVRLGLPTPTLPEP